MSSSRSKLDVGGKYEHPAVRSEIQFGLGQGSIGKSGACKSSKLFR